ncbi:MAG: YciI family protein [Actinomycetota bacterium]
MKVFAVTYHYCVSEPELNEVRPLHRQWLGGLLEQGILLASGPMLDSPNALLIFKAESASELSELLDNDPFDVAGFIDSRTIERWNPVFGPFSS